ncbi:recombinase family protein [Symmachiella dynata]|uniref:recombinase family protein n=1 Tax=Symmachiella dynata TaxID=2527995 RepID=UPI0030EBE9B4
MLLVETHKYVAYYRVSTQRQGQSGLGLEAQKSSVSRFVNGHGELIAELTEIETGKRSDRLELAKAIAQAKRCGATLVIAKLDRLARNVAFISALMESGVDFVACDNPHANRLTIHILAAVAEDEARRISQRTKEALAAYKARGGLLGSHHPRCKSISADAARKGQLRASERNREKARAAYADLLPIIRELYDAGKSLREVSRELNLLGHTTRTGRQWNPVQVKRVIDSAL